MMESSIFWNQHVTHHLPIECLGDEAQRLHRRLPGYAPTPLIHAEALAAQLGIGDLWIKDETERLELPAFKILGASWAIYQSLVERIGDDIGAWTTFDDLRARVAHLRPMTLAAATDGNHGRAVARMAALLGFGAHIFVPAGTVQPRIDAITAEGACVTVVDGTYDDAVARSAQEANEHCLVISDTSWPGYEDVPRWVIEGYSTILRETDDELRRRNAPQPDVVLVQMGVGALAAAVAAHYRCDNAPARPRIVGVEPNHAACILRSMDAGCIVEVPGPHDSIMAGLNCGVPSLIAWPVVSRGVDLFLAIDDERARQGMRMLATAGLAAGETGAAAMGGLIELVQGNHAPTVRRKIGLGNTSRVLLIVTEGATDPIAYQQIVGSAA